MLEDLVAAALNGMFPRFWAVTFIEINSILLKARMMAIGH